MMSQWHPGFRLPELVLWFLLVSFASAGPAPIVVPADTQWYGDDGNWNPVDIRVGTPPQWVSVFPNTAGQETWVIGRDGCDGSFTCRSKRGGLFLANESTSWQNVGYYELGFDLQFGDTGPGYYGLDNIALDQYNTYPNQVVAIINTTEYWLGMMGLGIRPLNFTDSSQLTFLSTLASNRSAIPSFSYGYTAGAFYRLKGVPASLTLGGVDQNRFTPTNVTFALSPDNLPVVSLNSISVSANPGSSTNSTPSFASPTTLLQSTSDGLFTIDSSTPFLWLPETACNAFSTALNLTYNNTLQVYTYGSTSVRSQLLNWNVTFKFTVADLPGSPNSVDIYIPLSAFDQTLTYPFPNYESQYTGDDYYYFALRQAANSTQYTLGRSFLQETYLTVDYERSNFSVSQAIFAADASTNMNIVAITPPANSNLTSSPTESSSLSTGAKVGIGVGAGIALLVILVAIAFCIWKRKKPSAPALTPPEKPENGTPEPEVDTEPLPLKPELLGDRTQPVEAPADASSTLVELSALPPDPVELQGSDSYYQPAGRKYNSGRSRSAYEETRRKLAAVEMPASQDELVAQEMPTSPQIRDHSDHEEQQAIHESRSTTLISPTSVRNSRFSGVSLPQSSPGFPVPMGPDDFQQSAISSTYSTHSTYQQLVRHPVYDGTYVASDRASSRGSRFVEQGLQGTSTPEPEPERTSFAAEGQRRGSDGSKRFSWEG